jgi:ATP/maltotriose-dependent transcriptional regulator MalT
VADAEERCGVDHVELLRLAAEAAYYARNWERGVSLLDEALAQPGGARVPLLVLRGTTLREWGRSDAAIATLSDAVAAVGPGDSGETRALALNVLAATHMRLGDMAQAQATVERALAAAREAGASLQEAQALTTLGTVRAYWGRSPEEGLAALREARDIAQRIGDQPLAVRASINLSDVLTLQGRYAEAVEVAAAGRELTERTGMTRSLGVYLVANEAEALLQLGRWDEAEALLPGAAASAIVELEARLALLRGRVDDAARAVQAARRELGDRREPQEGQALAYVEAAVSHARGDTAAARAIVARALTGDPAQAFLRYDWPLIAIGLRVEADGTPDPDRVGALVARAAALPATTPHDRAQQALAAAEAARARAEPAAEKWAAAIGAARATGEPHTLAYALLRAAEAGDKQAGPEGAALAERLGAAPLVALARRVGAVAVGRRDDGFGLTEREREVLSLVAEGRSNTQIAQALFISPKTASVHVSNILAKLGVSGRGEAAALAHRSGLI